MSLRCLHCGDLSPGLANLSLTIYTLLIAPRYDVVLVFLHGSDCQLKSWLARLISFTIFLRLLQENIKEVTILMIMSFEFLQ